MLVIAIFIIIISAYDIKNSYVLGANMEKQCGSVFMEKDRADFHVYSCYTESNDYVKPGGVFSNNNGSIKQRLKTAYEILLSGIIIIILVTTLVSVVISWFNNYNNEKLRIQWIGLVLLTIFGIAILFSLWMKGNYETGNPISLFNPYKDISYIYKEVDDYSKWRKNTIDKVVINQIAYIIIMLITVITSLYLTNTLLHEESYKIPELFIWGVGIILVILLVIIPLFIKSARAFEIDIAGKYERENKEKLNKLIINYKNENSETWLRIKTELENNITIDKRSNSKLDTFEKISLSDSTYKDYEPHLYMYLTHIVNKDNIIGIPIPQNLKSLLKPEYLAGERSIELKEDFIKAHMIYTDTKKTITKQTINAEYQFLKQYLKNDVKIKMGDAEYKLLNSYILVSDNFKKGNPLPIDIITQLAKMRKDTTIKNTVNEYFTKINIITWLVLLFIMYYIYHNIYPNNVEIKIQYVSMIVFILILIFGIIGWWMKEFWL